MKNGGLSKVFASSGSLEGVANLILEFYAGEPVSLVSIDEKTYNVVKGEKVLTPIVVRAGRRFWFGVR